MHSDPNLYDYWPYRDRPKIVWPGGKKVAFWIAPNIEYYEFDPPVNTSRPGWPKPSPDVVGYSQRDWGNRIGHWRLMELLDKYGMRGSISLSVGLIDHHPEIIEACVARAWEFFSHGIYNTRYSYQMSEAQERAVLEDSISSVLAATGQRIRGYLAPALTHTEHTLDLIAEYDFWYSCDLFQDDQPQPLKTRSGRLMSMPYSLEVNDVIAYGGLGLSPARYAEVLERHFDQLLEEGERSGTVMCIPLHAYLVSQPNRIRAFERALAHVASHADDVWITTAVEIAGFYREHCWDGSRADIERRGLTTGGTGFFAPGEGGATMPLDDNYLRYPRRAYGMDQDRYAWRPVDTRAPISWPDGKTIACMIVVPIEHHSLNPDGKPFKHPGAMVTPYPDLRHYTSRDYGNRVGVFRILDVLAARGIKATFPINAMALDRLRVLLDAIVADGHEVAAYGLSTNHIHWGGLDPAIEAAWVAETRKRFDDAGLSPRTWLSPARQQSFATLDLIAAAGFDACLDWEQDTLPVAMKTTTKPVLALPLSNELDDRTLLIDRRQSEDDWVDQVIEARDYTKAEHARRGAQMIGFTLTPYVSGQPFRIAPLRRMLDAIGSDPDTWCATAAQLTTEALARSS